MADTDFSLSLKRGSLLRPLYPVIVGVSKSQRFIEDIALWLEKNDFKIYRYYDRKRYDPRFKKGYSITHVIELSGHNNFEHWMQLIGFGSPKHLAKANKILNTYGIENKRIAGGGLSAFKTF